MSTPTSKKTYTRRNTRTRIVDLLKEAVSLVERGCPPGDMSRMPTLREADEEKSRYSLLPTSSAEAEAEEVVVVPLKRKGTARPGVVKYNEFVKKWISEHPDYQAKGKYQAALKEIQRTGAWAPSSVNSTRKIKTPSSNVTSANVTSANANANAISLKSANANAISLKSANANAMSFKSFRGSANATSLKSANANANATSLKSANANANAISMKSANANANATSLKSANANASSSYTNQGMDNTVGMRKIQMNGRNLYMTSNNGLFEREGNAPGDFIGRMVNGQIVQEKAPELPEYA